MKLLKLLFFLTILNYAVFAAPHTFHTSLTRMDYNAKEKLVEISIQLFTHDLVSVIEKQNKKSVDLEETKDVDQLIFKYLETNFILKNKTGAARKLTYVGKEIQAETTYIYLEIAAEETFENYNLQNTIFFESYEKQVNLVVARFGEEKADLFYKVGDKEKVIIGGSSPSQKLK